MKPFSPGDHVKMASRLADSLAANRRSKVDWMTRRGVIHCVNSSAVAVLWDGLKGLDRLPLAAVEKA